MNKDPIAKTCTYLRETPGAMDALIRLVANGFSEALIMREMRRQFPDVALTKQKFKAVLVNVGIERELINGATRQHKIKRSVLDNQKPSGDRRYAARRSINSTRKGCL